ncbi:MAG TPA: DUF4381 domain-containing protein [Steroidobacteraceae bacterium]|nr:DUF4381 domain-containing protein [Steroidobacteraceae bacterium]
MNTDWLAQLAPERAPAPPGWWPPAAGWWALLACLVLLCAAGVSWWRSPRRRLRRAALGELRRIRANEGDMIVVARAIQNLLRRYALAVFGSERVARLQGDAWLRFLANGGAQALRGAPGQALLRANFAGSLGEDRDQDCDTWFAAAEQFVRRAARRGVRERSG